MPQARYSSSLGDSNASTGTDRDSYEPCVGPPGFGTVSQNNTKFLDFAKCRGQRVAAWDPEFKSHSAVELIPGGVDSACHPSEVGKMSASLLVSCVGVVTCPGLCPIAQETA